MKKLSLSLMLLCSLFCENPFFAQNLIPNPDFEQLRADYSPQGKLDDQLKFWYSPTGSKATYLTRDNYGANIPEPAQGNGMVEMNYRAEGDEADYLQIRLTEPTVHRGLYEIEMSVYWATSDTAATPAPFAAFSHELPFRYETKTFIEQDGSATLLCPPVQPNTWQRVKAKITFFDFSRYLTFGFLTSSAYNCTYYIDSVSLYEDNPFAKIKNTNQKTPTQEEIEEENARKKMKLFFGLKEGSEMLDLKPGEKLIAERLYFLEGSAEIDSLSFHYLNYLSTFLSLNPDIHFEIAGHTDNVGTDATNLQLSQRRANRVKDYLEAQGVQPTQLEAKGYGKTKPVLPNTTEENRAKNRRVEFKLL